jgi:hypothetical protein
MVASAGDIFAFRYDFQHGSAARLQNLLETFRLTKLLGVNAATVRRFALGKDGLYRLDQSGQRAGDLKDVVGRPGRRLNGSNL